MTVIDPALAEAIEDCRASFAPGPDGPAAAGFDALLDRWPDAPSALVAVGEAHEAAGSLRTAATHYERALDAGLDGTDLRRGFLRLGGVLRRLGRLDEAVRVLEAGLDEFPGSRSLRTFLALALHEQGRADAAVSLLLQVLIDPVPSPDLVLWAPALRTTAEELASRANARGSHAAEHRCDAARPAGPRAGRGSREVADGSVPRAGEVGGRT